MGELSEKVTELADHVRHLETLQQMEANVRKEIQRAYLELGVLYDALPPVTYNTTEEQLKVIPCH